MKKYRYWIPSTFTLMNLCLGVVAILINDPLKSLVLIFIALFFDLFDGILARAINGQSEFGKQLDSLADLISFGVAPAYLVFYHSFLIDSNLRFVVVLIPVFSAIRLAMFNIDSSQKTNFRGLPTPANGLFFASIPYASNLFNVFYPDVLMAVVIVFFAFLLISPIRMFSFKNLKNGGVDLFFPLIFVAFVTALFTVFGLKIIPICVLLYVLMSIIYSIILLSKNSKSHS